MYKHINKLKNLHVFSLSSGASSCNNCCSSSPIVRLIPSSLSLLPTSPLVSSSLFKSSSVALCWSVSSFSSSLTLDSSSFSISSSLSFTRTHSSSTSPTWSTSSSWSYSSSLCWGSSSSGSTGSSLTWTSSAGSVSLVWAFDFVACFSADVVEFLAGAGFLAGVPLDAPKTCLAGSRPSSLRAYEKYAKIKC